MAIDCNFDQILKFNPNHDATGRFASSGGGAGGGGLAWGARGGRGFGSSGGGAGGPGIHWATKPKPGAGPNISSPTSHARWVARVVAAAKPAPGGTADGHISAPGGFDALHATSDARFAKEHPSKVFDMAGFMAKLPPEPPKPAGSHATSDARWAALNAHAVAGNLEDHAKHIVIDPAAVNPVGHPPAARGQNGTPASDWQTDARFQPKPQGSMALHGGVGTSGRPPGHPDIKPFTPAGAGSGHVIPKGMEYKDWVAAGRPNAMKPLPADLNALVGPKNNTKEWNAVFPDNAPHHPAGPGISLPSKQPDYQPGLPMKLPTEVATAGPEFKPLGGGPAVVVPDKTQPFVSSPGQMKQEQHLLNAVVVVTKPFKGGVSSGVAKLTFADKKAAVFKPESGEYNAHGRPGGRVRDHIDRGKPIEREVAAWEVAKMVGMDDLVAPTVERTINGKRGSLQLWQKGKIAMKAPYQMKYDGETDAKRAAAYDFVIGNEDRHHKNWMIHATGTNSDGGKGRIALIDHNLSFPDRGTNLRGNTQLIEHAQELSGGPAGFAKLYADAKPQILAKLKDLGMSEGAIRLTGARIDRLATAHSWSALEDDYTGDNGPKAQPAAPQFAQPVGGSAPSTMHNTSSRTSAVLRGRREAARQVAQQGAAARAAGVNDKNPGLTTGGGLRNPGGWQGKSKPAKIMGITQPSSPHAGNPTPPVKVLEKFKGPQNPAEWAVHWAKPENVKWKPKPKGSLHDVASLIAPRQTPKTIERLAPMPRDMGKT